MMKRTLLLLLFLSFFNTLQAQHGAVWNDKEAAVVLTYDDGLAEQLDHAVPLLDTLGLKATFYLTGYFPGFRERHIEWATVAQNGHELGNHTLFHPCDGQAPGRDWVQPEYDLNNYTIRRMVDEVQMTNSLLNIIENSSQRTFAYPCGEKKAGDSLYVSNIKDDVIAARGVEGNMQGIDDIDLYDIGAHMIDGQTGVELINLVQQAMDQNTLLVFLFHGVGGGHSLNVTLEAHRKLLYFLKQNEDQIWVAPMADIAQYIKSHKLGFKDY